MPDASRPQSLLGCSCMRKDLITSSGVGSFPGGSPMAEKSREKKKRDTVSAQNLLVLLDMKPPSFHKGGGEEPGSRLPRPAAPKEKSKRFWPVASWVRRNPCASALKEGCREGKGVRKHAGGVGAKASGNGSGFGCHWIVSGVAGQAFIKRG